MSAQQGAAGAVGHEEAYRRAAAAPAHSLVRGGALLAVLGLATFVLFALGDDPARAWRAYHVNFLFFTGLAVGGVVFSAAYRVSKGAWAGPIVRFAEAGAAFLPISLVAFLALFLGRHHLFPWIDHPTPARGPWLTTSWVFWRDLASLLAVFGVAIAYVAHNLRPDLVALGSHAPQDRRTLYERVSGGFTGSAAEMAENERRLNWLAPLLLVLYGYLFTLIAFDLVMSLAPYWYSTLFGWWFFMSAFLTGLTGLGLMMVYWRRRLQLHALIGRQQFHDLGKLVFGLSVFWAYLMFSQFLVQWYGNLPDETAFPFYRMWGEWRPIAVLVGLMVFLIPFWGLIWVKSKITPFTFTLFVAVSLVGMWLERYLLVQPSLTEHGPEFGLPEVGVTMGFLGLFLLAYGWFARSFPMVSPRLADETARWHH
ncbi:MAG TPA: NrfD/PsrC family molybdoenzyme membrane anchor subunit [Gemmatimonadales bacterium]|nr:NrfD/PsrC family molybdoenzyme membrane anchor subunit [Gemmatimonadales bacterium]